MKQHPEITIGQAFKNGWHYTKAFLEFAIGYQIIVFFFYAAQLYFQNSFYGWQGNVAAFLLWIVGVLFQMGWVRSCLLIVKENIRPKFDQLYRNWRLLISWVVAHFLCALLVAVGFVLLIIPGFYFLARYSLLSFVILDKDAGPLEAFGLAAEASRGIRGRLFLFMIAAFFFNLLGFLLLIVGLLFTIPVTWFALAWIYSQTQKPVSKTEELTVVSASVEA